MFFEMAWMAKGSGCIPLVLSNGMFLEDEDLTKRVLDLDIPFQITTDSRLYPKEVPRIEHELFTYEHDLRMMMPLGRAAKNKVAVTNSGIPWHVAPSCFNLRSIVRAVGTLQKAILMLRQHEKFCTPSINIDGSVSAGETNLCHKIGTVDSDEQELVDNILAMECNTCGLEDNLTEEQCKAIGREQVIWRPSQEVWTPE
jgi:hypothetical protein